MFLITFAEVLVFLSAQLSVLRKSMVETLSETLMEFEKVLLFDELPGEAVLTKVAFQNFLCERAKVATGMQEKLAGCQARLKSR